MVSDFSLALFGCFVGGQSFGCGCAAPGNSPLTSQRKSTLPASLISGVKEVPKKKPPKCPPIGEASLHIEVVSPLPLSPPQPIAIALIVSSELSGSFNHALEGLQSGFWIGREGRCPLRSRRRQKPRGGRGSPLGYNAALNKKSLFVISAFTGRSAIGYQLSALLALRPWRWRRVWRRCRVRSGRWRRCRCRGRRWGYSFSCSWSSSSSRHRGRSCRRCHCWCGRRSGCCGRRSSR